MAFPRASPSSTNPQMIMTVGWTRSCLHGLMSACGCLLCVFFVCFFFLSQASTSSRQPLTLLHVWPQGGAGVGAPGPAAAADAQRPGEHAAGQGHAHHHQVKDTDMQLRHQPAEE